MMVDVVSGATWTIFAPASWCCPSEAIASDNTSPCARGPIRYTLGYFIVIREPRFPSTHSMTASSYATARFVTRLYTFVDQFWIVVYRTRAPFCTMISSTALCSESVEYVGAVQPST